MTSRRTFVQLVSGGIGLAAASRSYAAAPAPSDQIEVGFIGLGGQGTSRLKEFMRQPDVRAAAVCDLDRTHLDAAVAAVEKAQGHKPDSYHDFRKLLERKDLDAVMVATPDHWHALPAIQACQAGKDVFVEKPLAYSIGEGRAMVTAALKNKRITQMGNHIHNDRPTYRRVVEVIQSGALGRIRRVDCSLVTASTPIGRTADTVAPPELDSDFSLGPAPKPPYHPLRSH